MKIVLVICLTSIMVLAFGDALKCYSCTWTKDETWSPNHDERCVNPESLPEEFLMDCPFLEESSCVLAEKWDGNMKTSVVRSCTAIETEIHECQGFENGHSTVEDSICFCDKDGCNFGK